ncbi:MAG TPA: hypothetical protein VHZ95_05475 [Polyangiales bacterium]|jgi:phage shock protein A|nr:hypothetical protein [Polyangiales bacterium]
MRLAGALLVLFAATAPARADVWADVAATERAIGQLDSARAQVEGRRRELEQQSRELATQIEAVKAEPAGVRRDANLQELLAAQRSKSDELEHLSADLRGRVSLLAGARRKLVTDCDRALLLQLPEAKRLELTRLRTAQVTSLAQTDHPLGVARPTADPLDGPRELQEKADLLRDSGDKLRHEAQRLALRIDNVERRRHLRERAGAIDEDLFGESISNRHSARISTSSDHGLSPTTGAAGNGTVAAGGAGGGAGSASPTGGSGAGGGSGSTGPTSGAGGTNNGVGTTLPTSPGSNTSAPPSDATLALRNLVDPATLDELRRADGGDDLERQLRALRRAQGELDGLAKELDRRAHDLSLRADELKHKK